MNRRATTKERKRQVILRLYRLWKQNPELRLGQLIENVYHHENQDHCFYAVEDFDFIEKLEAKYNTPPERLPN